MSDTRWIDAFLEAQASELSAARNTLLAYGRDLKAFSHWLGQQQKTLAGASQADIESFLVGCEAEGLSEATRARRLSAIRQLYRFTHEEDWRHDNPALQIRGPTRRKSLPTTLTQEEVIRLLDAAALPHRDATRNSCLLQMLYATGMRVSELVGLPVATVRGDPEMILIRGKGGRERMVPLSLPARTTLLLWLAERDAAEEKARLAGRPPSRFLFPSRGRSGHLTRNRFYLLIKEMAARAGIDPSKVSPHTLRHAFATHMLAGGADLRAIQTLLGHSDISTTEIYTHVLDEHLRQLVLERHPLARDA
ncbi:integrase/recombinase XerD [Rhodovulum imhoffii]|uniref:Tyrosine recombinase XerC n=1 Tax=Rhodovulum imhoffii TaxID=365340 RepID=A0A2T5BTI5_9RHOB|nr:tyrosine recombinase [Rhodovulum imhoffii]MBK5934311.1 recombinase XerD [Rhodovulum imhoffii]PTN02741.1 integrase/recombinase XerD [Rhodovulum imhoffii]